MGPGRSTHRCRWLVTLVLLVVIPASGCGENEVPVAWPDRSAGGPLPIEVTGKRFEWQFRFPGADGRFGTGDDLVSRRDLHLPVGVAVELKLTSEDYIYTLSLPGLGLQEIAVPELFHSLRLEAGRNGSYRLLSDSMCAVRFSHDEEMGRVLVEEPTAFDQWLVSLP